MPVTSKLLKLETLNLSFTSCSLNLQVDKNNLETPPQTKSPDKKTNFTHPPLRVADNSHSRKEKSVKILFGTK